MAIMITDECINCGACEPECPNNAIYEGGVEWKYSEGTGLSGSATLAGGKTVDADTSNNNNAVEDADDSSYDDEEAEKEEESTATFEPVVKLEEVEVKSGEEDEVVIYSQRSKLFIYGETLLDKGTGKKSWRERGIGEVRILRHTEHQRLRLLMRQEKTMKVIANHAIDPRIKVSWKKKVLVEKHDIYLKEESRKVCKGGWNR